MIVVVVSVTDSMRAKIKLPMWRRSSETEYSPKLQKQNKKALLGDFKISAIFGIMFYCKIKILFFVIFLRAVKQG